MKSDLTDEELRDMATAHDRLRDLNLHVGVVLDALMNADQLHRAAVEIRRHRAMVKRLKSLRDEWAADGTVNREWLGEAFVADLDALLEGPRS